MSSWPVETAKIGCWILGWQHHLGKDMRYGLSNAEWWTLAALKLQEKAEDGPVKMDKLGSWRAGMFLVMILLVYIIYNVGI